MHEQQNFHEYDGLRKLESYIAVWLYTPPLLITVVLINSSCMYTYSFIYVSAGSQPTCNCAYTHLPLTIPLLNHFHVSIKSYKVNGASQGTSTGSKPVFSDVLSTFNSTSSHSSSGEKLMEVRVKDVLL